MSKIVIKVVAPHVKRRASELFSAERNFAPKRVESRKSYRRKDRFRQDWQR
jgi:hypothetical protein